MPEHVSRATLTELANLPEQICLSLYMPTHRTFPQSDQNLIRYKNLLRQLRKELNAKHPEVHTDALMRPFESLLDDHNFWIHQGEGLVVFGGEHFFKLYLVQRSVPERVVVNTHPYLKPLIRIVQSADNYQVLYLTRDEVRLFEGNRDALHEVELAPEVPRNQVDALGADLTEGSQSGHPDGFAAANLRGDPYMHEAGGSGKQDEIDNDRNRFFREVDRAIYEYHSKPSGLPLILAALPENQSFFRAGSHNQHLVERGVLVNPGALDLESLRKRCWKVMSEHYTARLDALLDIYGMSRGQGLASDQLGEIGRAALQGRVATLLVEAGRQVPGELNQENGEVKLEGISASADLLDELVLQGIHHGGEVIVVPPERMPSQTGAAALYRF